MSKHKGKSRGGDHIAGQRHEREKPPEGEGGVGTATLELGIKIKMTEVDQIAEKAAKHKEAIEIQQTNLENCLTDLQAAMHREKRTFVNARAAGGIVYTFELSTPEEKVKIKKVA